MRQSSLYQQDPLTKARNQAEKRFQFYGKLAIAAGMAALCFLFLTIAFSGWNGFRQSTISVFIQVAPEQIEKAESALLKTSEYEKLVAQALREGLEAEGIQTTALDDKEFLQIVSERTGVQIREIAQNNPELLYEGQNMKVLASARIDGYLKGRVSRESIANDKNISIAALDLADEMMASDILKQSFNWGFFTSADSGETSPESAGFGAAILGSLAMMIVVIALALPIGIGAAIYLEEFAPKNRWTDLIEVNISNLAAVPSIVFGILGLSLFLNMLGPLNDADWLRRNAPFVGGLVLTLMTLPQIVIPTRAALKAVPQSIRDAALGVGASKMQTIFHHVLPLAMPGILTGAIIGIAQAIGETAPLLMIGLVGYVGASIPTTMDQFFGGPNSVMPAQIYTWAGRTDPAWYEKAWAGIVVLLCVLFILNILAVFLRQRFERRW